MNRPRPQIGTGNARPRGVRFISLVIVLLVAPSLASSAPRCRQKDRVKRLICQFQDENPLARRSASYELVELGVGVAPALIEALRHRKAAVRQAAVRTLASMQTAAAAAVLPLARALKDRDVEVRRAAALALESLGPAAEKAIPALTGALRDTDGEVKNYAALALGTLGKAAAPATAALARMLDDKDASLSERAALTLGSIGPRADAAIPALIRTLAPSRPSAARRAAAYALGEIGGKASRAIPALKKMSMHKDPWVAGAAKKALRRLRAARSGTPPPRPVIPPGSVVFDPGPTNTDLKRATTVLSKDLARFLGRRMRPRIEIGRIGNRSSSHINTNLFRVLLYRELSRLGCARIVGGPRARPRFLLGGRFLGDDDVKSRKRRLVGLIIGLSLVDLRTRQKVWLGIYPVRKLVEQTAKGRLPRVKLLGPEESPGFSTTLSIIDARKIGARIVKALLASRQQPVRMRVGPVSRRTSEHSYWPLITMQIEQKLIASGKVQIFENPFDLLLPEGRSLPERKLPEIKHVLKGVIRSSKQRTSAGCRRTYTIETELLKEPSRKVLWFRKVTVDKGC